MEIIYVTGNQSKIEEAQRELMAYGISIKGQKIGGIIEPQASNIKEISLSKARQAFEQIKKPLIVNDSGWNIPALKGFPGAYMSYVNDCFSPSDFLNLLKDKEDRSVKLVQCITYIDERVIKQVAKEFAGVFLEVVKGEGKPSDCVISFRDDGKSLAECQEEGISSFDNSELWGELAGELKGL